MAGQAILRIVTSFITSTMTLRRRSVERACGLLHHQRVLSVLRATTGEQGSPPTEAACGDHGVHAVEEQEQSAEMALASKRLVISAPQPTSALKKRNNARIQASITLFRVQVRLIERRATIPIIDILLNTPLGHTPNATWPGPPSWGEALRRKRSAASVK